MSGALTKPNVLKPGPSLIAGGRALESKRRQAGVWPYQWLFPGPHSKQVRPNGSQVIPAYGTLVNLLQYTVPEGMRFSMRGIVVNATTGGWTEGDGNLIFNLAVQGSGPRNVDFLNNINTRLGSSLTPFPIMGRLEFEPLDVLTLTMLPVAVVDRGAPNFGYGMLVGHLYPNSETEG